MATNASSLTGVSSELLAKYGFPYCSRVFHPTGDPRFSAKYDRGDGDIVGPMPCRNHNKYALRGFIAVSLHIDNATGSPVPAPVPVPPSSGTGQGQKAQK